jgi:hypothetical protein
MIPFTAVGAAAGADARPSGSSWARAPVLSATPPADGAALAQGLAGTAADAIAGGDCPRTPPAPAAGGLEICTAPDQRPLS